MCAEERGSETSTKLYNAALLLGTLFAIDGLLFVQHTSKRDLYLLPVLLSPLGELALQLYDFSAHGAFLSEVQSFASKL